MSIQPVLFPCNGVATDLHVVRSESDGFLTVFLGVAVLERVRCCPELLQYKLFIGRLVNFGWALSTLQQHFGHDPRTMKNWAAALLSDDESFVIAALSGRGGCGKITEPIRRYVHRRYLALRGNRRQYRQIIKEEVEDLFGESLSVESLRILFRQADIANVDGENQEEPSPAIMVTGCPFVDVFGGGDGDGNDNQSPDFGAGAGVPFSHQSVPLRPIGVHHAGMSLFAALLARFFAGRWGEHLAIQAQWLGQILQGAVNIEQSRLITGSDLGRFTGPILAGIQAQRERLYELASPSAVLDVYAANASLLPDGPNKDRVFYYDPHSKEYTGMLKVLKDWCGRRHGVSKVMHLDMIHTRSGRPCFVQHYSPYYDLRERFFMTLQQFDALFTPEHQSGRIFVLDRGIYGIATFQRFITSGNHVLTWEKDYRKNGWNDDAPCHSLSRFRARNHASDLRRYSFVCQESEWPRDPRFRRIIVRATNPKNRTIEVSILCSDPRLDLEELVWLMFQRWLQENSFKYLDKHFGLNQLTSYASQPVADIKLTDQDVDSIEYRELKGEIREAETELARCLLQREKLTDKLSKRTALRDRFARQLNQHMDRLQREIDVVQADMGDRKSHAKSAKNDQELKDLYKSIRKVKDACQRLEKQLAKLAIKIEQLKSQTEDLEQRLCDAVRYQSRLRLLIDNQYRLLNPRCKALLDAVRITAANMFACLVDTFRPIYCNYRNDHAMLRNLTRADGFLYAVDSTIHVDLWLKGQFVPKQIQAFHRFLSTMTDRINADRNRKQQKAAPIRIRLVQSTPTL